jgi:hypothetical protein
MEPMQESNGDLVYHYTTPAGLKGIIKDRCVWATNVNHLNDASEYQHGIDFIREEAAVRELHPEELAPAGSEVTKFMRDCARAASIAMIQHHFQEKDYSRSVFAASFFVEPPRSTVSEEMSDAGDVLEQWRAYSQGGRGFSVGFDRYLLERRVSAKDPGTANGKTACGNCIYDTEEKKSEVDEIFRCLAPALFKLLQGSKKLVEELRHALAVELCGVADPSAITEIRHNSPLATAAYEAAVERCHWTEELRPFMREMEKIFPDFAGRLIALPALMKDPSFKTEREWRIIRFTVGAPSQIEFRTDKSGLVPYVEIPVSDTSDPSLITEGLIKRIVVGPFGSGTPRERDNAVAAIKMLLEKHRIRVQGPECPEGVLVQSSRVPLRA